MNVAYLNSSEFSFFSCAQDQLDQIIDQLQSDDSMDNEHGDIEKYINQEGQELLRCLLQGWLNLKAAHEEHKSCVTSTTGESLNHVRPGTTRKLSSLFGEVVVTRKGYSQRNHSSVFPLDADLNLPEDQYSDGLRHRLSKEAIRGSFDNAIEAIDETTGGFIPIPFGIKFAIFSLLIIIL